MVRFNDTKVHETNIIYITILQIADTGTDSYNVNCFCLSQLI